MPEECIFQGLRPDFSNAVVDVYDMIAEFAAFGWGLYRESVLQATPFAQIREREAQPTLML